MHQHNVTKLKKRKKKKMAHVFCALMATLFKKHFFFFFFLSIKCNFLSEWLKLLKKIPWGDFKIKDVAENIINRWAWKAPPKQPINPWVGRKKKSCVPDKRDVTLQTVHCIRERESLFLFILSFYLPSLLSSFSFFPFSFLSFILFLHNKRWNGFLEDKCIHIHILYI